MALIANIKEKAVYKHLESKLKVMRIWRKMRVKQTRMWMMRRRTVPGMLQKTNLLEWCMADLWVIMAHQFSLSRDIIDIIETTSYSNSHQLMDIFKSCELNWFSFVEVIKENLFNLEEREELHDNRAKPTSISPCTEA